MAVAEDDEAFGLWKKIAGFPEDRIIRISTSDNFWAMGDTGPCGPCSEVHFNLLPSDDEAAGRKLVNASSPRCIEIWNHVFIQFNANSDGTFSPLAAKHVDTGMGFERVAGIHATTNGFKDFSRDPSNYAADVFAPLLTKVAALSGKSERTVRQHAVAVYRKSGLGGRAQLAAFFFEDMLLPSGAPPEA